MEELTDGYGLKLDIFAKLDIGDVAMCYLFLLIAISITFSLQCVRTIYLDKYKYKNKMLLN